MTVSQEAPPPRGLWPIDRLFIAYSTVMVCLLVPAARHDSFAYVLIAGHAVAVGGLFVLARNSSPFPVFLRHWYLLGYLPFAYKEVPFMVAALGLRSADSTLAHWDRVMWNVDPVFWLSAVQNPIVVELLQLVYTLFIPGVLALGVVVWFRNTRAEFRYATFAISATFLISYLGYLVLPARGPRFMDYASQHAPLSGLWAFNLFQHSLDVLEGKQYDCFPSGHTAVVLVGCFVARRVSRRVFYLFSVFAALIAFSTIYLRYHYVIDVIVGIVLALIVVTMAPIVYRRLEPANTA